MGRFLDPLYNNRRTVIRVKKKTVVEDLHPLLLLLLLYNNRNQWELCLVPAQKGRGGGLPIGGEVVEVEGINAAGEGGVAEGGRVKPRTQGEVGGIYFFSPGMTGAV